MASEPLLRLGTRRSPLAVAQAEETRRRLCAAHGWEESAVELIPVLASGDKVQDRPLADIGGKALWTKELDACLAAGTIDAAVHSLKDVETWRPESLVLAAILPRADKRDVLIGAASLSALPEGAVIGTSAPRRAAQALHARPDCRVVTFRGNVATRLRRLQLGEADATLLAAAGLDRLAHPEIGVALEEMLPAPAQGAVGVEVLAENRQVAAVVAAIGDPATEACVSAERRLLEGLGGDCRSPVAALALLEDGAIHLRAEILTGDGSECARGEIRFPEGDAQAPLGLAATLLGQASPALRALFAG